ncbi:MAG: ABC transporter permease [Thermoanaerobaculales bacterium]|nr:ABC transporter permease [Thermoanaerobaculales bacterium]
MMFLESRNLLRRPRRTVLTLIGVTVGAAGYMTLLAAGAGLFAEFQDAISLLGSDLVVQQASAATAWTSRIAPADIRSLRSVPGVNRVTEVVVAATRFLGQKYFIVFGLEPESTILAKARIVDGRPYRANGAEMMVGQRAARAIGLAAGDRVEARGRRFLISGIYETDRSILDGGAVMNLEAARSMFSYGVDTTVVFVDVKGPQAIDEVMLVITDTLPHLEVSRSDMWVSTYEQFVVVRRFARGLGVFALLITAMWVSNTLHVTILERRAELALLRAVGWRKRRIAVLVLREGLAFSVVGGFTGIPVAALIVWGLRNIGAAGIVSAKLSPEIVVEGVVIAVLAGLVGCVPPLVRALRMQALEALRAT